MKNVSDNICRKKSKHMFYVQDIFFNLAVYEIMWQNVLEQDRTHMPLWRTRIASWIPKATDTHPQNM